MKTPFTKTWLLALLLTLASLKSFGQKQFDVNDLIAYTKAQLPQSDLLAQGRLYQQRPNLAKGDPFLFTDSFTQAAIFIKDYCFNEIPVLIDLEKDQIIIKLSIDGLQQNVLLSKNAFDSIQISNSTFLSINELPQNQLVKFPQLLYKGNLMLLCEYQKDFISTYNDLTPYGSYSKLLKKYYVIKNDEFITINNKKALLNLSQNPQQLKAELKKRKFKLKKANNQQLASIIKLIDNGL